jgi:hypothetical protein
MGDFSRVHCSLVPLPPSLSVSLFLFVPLVQLNICNRSALLLTVFTAAAVRVCVRPPAELCVCVRVRGAVFVAAVPLLVLTIPRPFACACVWFVSAVHPSTAELRSCSVVACQLRSVPDRSGRRCRFIRSFAAFGRKARAGRWSPIRTQQRSRNVKAAAELQSISVRFHSNISVVQSVAIFSDQQSRAGSRSVCPIVRSLHAAEQLVICECGGVIGLRKSFKHIELSEDLIALRTGLCARLEIGIVTTHCPRVVTQ